MFRIVPLHRTLFPNYVLMLITLLNTPEIVLGERGTINNRVK